MKSLLRPGAGALRSLAFVFCAVLFAGDVAADAQRLALVVGIDDYANIDKLQKARNDAVAVTGALERTGFEVDTALDPKRQELNFALARFVDRLGPGDEAVFYFAGHGIEIDGRNYLLASDIPALQPGQQSFLTGEALPVDRILNMIRERGARVSLLIVDACRDNPFPREGTRSIGASRGLGRVDAPAGAFILFSAGVGQTALDRLSNDDPDPNSVFTRQLLPLLEEPGLPITDVARRVRVEVMELAQTIGHDQRPAYYDEITGDFAFVPAAARPAPPAPTFAALDPCEAARAVWETIEMIGNRGAVEAFIEVHEGCPEAVAVAQARLDTLPAAAAVNVASAAWELVRDTSDPALLERFAAAYDASPFVPEARARAEALRSAMVSPPQDDAGAGSAGPPPEAREEARSALLHVPPDPPAVGPAFAGCDGCPEMVRVTGTEVLFGAPEAYLIAQRDERPPLRLSLPEPFDVAVTETTQAQFARFVQATGHDWSDTCRLNLPDDRLPVIGARAGAVPDRPDLPVVCVSWEDAQAYVAWLSETSGQRYRLLREVEFEYLAEAFHFNTPLEEKIAGLNLCDWVNIADLGSGFSWRDFSCEQPLGPGVLPARSLQPDNFGLYHLLGNVWEWVEDCYAETPEATVTGQSVGSGCDRRSMRGGSWTDPLGTLRTSNRNWDRPDYRADNVGFRVARDP